MAEFRRMRIDDVHAAAELEAEAFGKEAWKEKDFVETLGLDYALYVVAFENEQLAGICGLRNLCGDADITNVAVSDCHRRKGIARAMLKFLMEESETLGVQQFTLEVRAGNTPAIKLYEGLGFVTEGVRKNFYTDPVEDALIMWNRDWRINA